MTPPRQSDMPEARLAGHAIGALAGLASLVGGIASLMHGQPPVLGVTMLIMGGLLPVLALFSYQYSRIAWSFLSAIMIVMAIVTLFGSPKVRNMLHIPLGAAMVIPFVLVCGVIALMLVANDYRTTESQKSQNVVR